MIVSSEKIEIPDDCGGFCSIMRREGRKFPFSHQGDDCSRCPIVNCMDDPDIGPLLSPAEYRADWVVWYKIVLWDEL